MKTENIKHISVNSKIYTFKLWHDKDDATQADCRTGATIRTLLGWLDVADVVSYDLFVSHYMHKRVPLSAIAYAMNVMGLIEYTKTDDNKLGLRIARGVYRFDYDGQPDC